MNLDSWMVDTVIVAPRVGADSRGMPTYGAQTTVQARVESKSLLALAPTRNELKFDHKICTLTPINPDDRVWLPGDDTTSTDAAKRPISIDFAYTKFGDFTLYVTYL